MLLKLHFRASGTKDPRISPAISQLLFAFATAKDAGSWSVRKLAEFAGISKSNVAKVEQQLVAQGVLIESEEGFRLRDRSKLPEELLRGYELALRPKLLLGRFRSPASEIDEMLVRPSNCCHRISKRLLDQRILSVVFTVSLAGLRFFVCR